MAKKIINTDNAELLKMLPLVSVGLSIVLGN